MKKKIIFAIALLLCIGLLFAACIGGGPAPSVPQDERTYVPTDELPAGFAGFSLQLYETHTFEPWWVEDGWFRVGCEDVGAFVMHIGQLPDIGMTAEEYIAEMAAERSEDGLEFTYEPPTADFPFFSLTRFDTGETGKQMQAFARDNEQGGLFYVTILLDSDDWEEGHGPRLLNALANMEIIVA